MVNKEDENRQLEQVTPEVQEEVAPEAQENPEVQENPVADNSQDDNRQEQAVEQDDNRQDDNRQPVEKTQEDEYEKKVQNWRALRAAKVKEEQERIKLQKEKEELLARYQQQSQDDLSLNDDDLAEGKHVKQVQKKTEQRIIELENRLVEAQIRAKYNDYDQVVNDDTVGMLRDTDPDLAASLAANPNPYSQAVAVYNSIKRYGLDRSAFDKDRQKVTTNTSKPRTVNSLSPQQAKSPLSRANAFAEGMTDEMKEARWREAQKILEG